MLRKPQVPEGQRMGTFIAADDLEKGENRAVIVGIREAPANMDYSEYLLTLQLGKREFVMGLKSDTSTYELLVNGLGEDETKWAGREIMIRARYSKKYPDGFVEPVEVLPATKAAKAK
jgi:hypothetical protein